MSCNCAGAPHLSGPVSGNVIKLQSESVALSASWCSEIEPDGDVLGSVWSVTPESLGLPVSFAQEAINSPVTSAVLSGGQGGTLYRVENKVRLLTSLTGPTIESVFTWWVWVRATKSQCDQNHVIAGAGNHVIAGPGNCVVASL